MTFKKHTIRALLSAGTVAIVAMAGSGVAHADPAVGTYRTIAMVGSDTTQDVMNQLAEDPADLAVSGVKQVASYNATGSATINTQAASACQGITRPNGSGAGRTALLASLTAGNGCIQGSRSSSLDLSAATPKLVYIPFATENITYAVSGTSNIPLSGLAKSDVQDIYKCLGDPAWKAMLPQSGSGTRNFWITQMYGTLPNPVPSCVENGTDENGVLIEEHRGTQVNNNEITPFSVAQWEAQTADVITNFRGTTRLGQIDGTNPFAANFAIQRDLYNVFPVSNLTGSDTVSNAVKAVFVGSSSKICTNTAKVVLNGMRVASTCGSTTNQTA